MNRWKTTLVLLTLVALLGTACHRKPTGPECPINIGIITSLTGRHASGGCEHILGYEMARDDINAAGGILGCPVNLIVRDDASTEFQAQLAVTDLVDDAGVPVILGAYSSAATLSAAGVANVYGIPLVVPTASSDLITAQGYEWVFRINAPSRAYASTALDFVQEELGDSATLAVIYDGQLFGESAAVAVATGAAERGLNVVAYEAYKSGSTDYTSLLARVQETDPDVIYFAANSEREAAQLMKQCRDLDLNPRVYIGHAGGFVMPGFLSEAGEDAEFIIATAQWAFDVSWPGVPEFAARFPEFATRFTENSRPPAEVDLYTACIEQTRGMRLPAGRQPPAMRTAQTYTTLTVVSQAIELAGQKESLDWTKSEDVRQAIRQALQELALENTIFGPIQFDEVGQNAHPVLLVQVIDHEFVTIYPEQYSARAPVVPVPSWSERQPAR